ncbi:hypothetical protein WUBG_07899 [Wuchereria bancrofti]|uniref:Uncharacterized protein n=1 Tax=Wuchereria bancrofti TaxID=6293 RepID=J9F1F9_WUCBA|nr:hypothetical protein WUBG_07899 [Wuchereria bancrofti]
MARGPLVCFRLHECTFVVVNNAQMLNSQKCAVVIMLATHEVAITVYMIKTERVNDKRNAGLLKLDEPKALNSITLYNSKDPSVQLEVMVAARKETGSMSLSEINDRKFWRN